MTRPFKLHTLPTTLLLLAGWMALYCTPGSPAEAATTATSQWVYAGAGGKLQYKTLERGDRIMDFSFSGYGGGGVQIPSVSVRKSVAPSGGDDTAAIQAAIDSVSQLPLVDGFRGAVLLAAGTFNCSGVLSIKADGVALRGSGSGVDGTTIRMHGAPHVCISIGDPASPQPVGTSMLITDTYVPSGATSFTVANASGLRTGDTILIRRPVTPAWVHFMGMDVLVRNGKPERWLSGVLSTERTILSNQGSKITLDVPLSDSFDSTYLSPPGASVVKALPIARTARVGVENLRIVSPPQPISIDQPQNQALVMNAAADSWLRDIDIKDTINSVEIGGEARRVTVQDVHISHTVATTGAALPADFTASGTQSLFYRCRSTGDHLFYFITGARATGPSVLLHCTFHGNGLVQPHARWATGLLVDSCRVPNGAIDFMNRGEMGSGHGWTVGWAAAWNCVASSFIIQQPPGSTNWAIGCQGTRKTAPMPFDKNPALPEGIYDSYEVPVVPPSLYLAQLRDRMGEGAVKAIGY